MPFVDTDTSAALKSWMVAREGNLGNHRTIPSGERFARNSRHSSFLLHVAAAAAAVAAAGQR